MLRFINTWDEPAVQAYFGWAKPCSCSHCCSRHLWFYDSGRLVRRRKKESGDPPLFLLSSVSTWRFREQKHLRARRKRLQCRLLKISSIFFFFRLFTTGRNFNYLSKGWFPLSRNFYVRTCVKFTFANKIEAMYEGSHVSVKVETRSTSRLAQHLISCLYLYLFTWFKFTCVKYVCNTDVFIRAPLY